VCDVCGGEVIQRDDDKEDVIATRLKTYEENTVPLRAYFKEQGKYVEINGNQDTETVFKALKKAIS
jgi:adenylate kinase